MPRVLERGKARPTTEDCELEVTLGLSGELNSSSNNTLRSRTSERSDDSNETVVYRRKKSRCMEESVSGPKKAKSCFRLEHREDSGSSEGRIETEPSVFGRTRQVRSAFEAQFSGNTQAIADNFEYLLEGLEARNDESLRRVACEELLYTIEDARHFSVFKAHGFAEIALSHLLTKQVRNMGLIAASVGLLNKFSELEHDAIWLAEWIIDPSNRSKAITLFRSGLTNDLSQCQQSSKQEKDPIFPDCSQVSSVGHKG